MTEDLGCGHSSNEDCMSCHGCMDGICTESLNEDDLCPRCAEEAYPICAEEGCTNPQYESGWCMHCYWIREDK